MRNVNDNKKERKRKREKKREKKVSQIAEPRPIEEVVSLAVNTRKGTREYKCPSPIVKFTM